MSAAKRLEYLRIALVAAGLVCLGVHAARQAS